MADDFIYFGKLFPSKPPVWSPQMVVIVRESNPKSPEIQVIEIIYRNFCPGLPSLKLTARTWNTGASDEFPFGFQASL